MGTEQNQEEIFEAVLHSPDLPTLPTVASKVIALTGREDTTLSDIAELIAKDMALSAKILKVSNSSFYSFPQQISSINQAVSLLGINAVRSLVLSFSFLSMKGKAGKTNFDFKKFWEDSLAGGIAAKLILEQIEGADTEEILISGLLQNIGQLALACSFPDEYNKILEATDEKPDDEEPEKTQIGAGHTFVGYNLAKEWKFPEKLLVPILYHHDPDQYEGNDRDMQQTIAAVYLSSLLVRILNAEQPEVYHKKFRKEAKRLLGLKTLSINKILKQVHFEINQAAEFFEVRIKARSVEEILQEANLRLSLLNMSYEEVNRELIKSKMELEKLTRELEAKNKLLENLANIDGLTEIHNHRFFQNFLDKEINRAIRNEHTISILMADVDNFKKFNDTYGHQVGDFVLKEFSKMVAEQIRQYDLVARYGGEEFVFVIPETGPDEAMLVGEKIRKATEEHPFNDGSQVYHVTVSIGVACAKPSGPGFKKHEFIGLADEALYAAKNKGRNRVEKYAPQKKKKWFAF